MGKLKCKCGYLIVDQADNLEYKGYVLPDTYVDDVSESLTNNMDSLHEANKNGHRLEWIKEKFEPGYPTDLKDSAMIHDLLNVIDRAQDIFECENCGRIAIQVGQTEEFKFFTPDSENSKGILRGKKK